MEGEIDNIPKEGSDEKEIEPESKTGYSLSLCIADILQGKVKEEEIKEIVAATTARSPEAWNNLIERHKKTYWKDDPERAEEIVRRLLAERKVKQPLLDGRPRHIADFGRWGGIDSRPVYESDLRDKTGKDKSDKEIKAEHGLE